MRKWLVRILVVLLALVFVNDTGRFLMGMYRVDERTREMAFQAQAIADHNQARNSGWPTAQKIAQDSGLEVTGYRQDRQGVYVTTRYSITGTYVLGPVHALMVGTPMSTPFPWEGSAFSKA